MVGWLVMVPRNSQSEFTVKIHTFIPRNSITLINNNSKSQNSSRTLLT